jgi:hypothetical protein
LDFHPVEVVGKLVQKQETDRYIQKEKKYTKQRIHKIENNIQKQENKYKKNIQNIFRVFRK